MNFSPFPILKTKRLLLTNLGLSDNHEILFLRSDPEVNKFISRPTPANLADADAFINKIAAGIEKGENIYWKISTKESNKMIGAISLWQFSDDLKTAEIGYDLHPDFQGKGLMSEAMNAVLNFGFNTLNFEDIEAYTHRDNHPSRHLLVGKGFKLIKDKVDPGNLNNIIYSLPKAEFKLPNWMMGSN
jgi:ribosomal-protein-alanine N-acetyltransferase